MFIYFYASFSKQKAAESDEPSSPATEERCRRRMPNGRDQRLDDGNRRCRQIPLPHRRGLLKEGIEKVGRSVIYAFGIVNAALIIIL